MFLFIPSECRGPKPRHSEDGIYIFFEDIYDEICGFGRISGGDGHGGVGVAAAFEIAPVVIDVKGDLRLVMVEHGEYAAC